MTGTVQRIFHLAAFCWYAFVVQSLYAKGDEDLPPGIFVYGGPWKYLTFLNLVGELLLHSKDSYENLFHCQEMMKRL